MALYLNSLAQLEWECIGKDLLLNSLHKVARNGLEIFSRAWVESNLDEGATEDSTRDHR